jgi:hypothetical protein
MLTATCSLASMYAPSEPSSSRAKRLPVGVRTQGAGTGSDGGRHSRLISP